MNVVMNVHVGIMSVYLCVNVDMNVHVDVMSMVGL